ncbi:MAG: hypothetical protein IJV06_01660 [Bacteroidaceae bacterium]|nr:hypothetical protein [Bacteroidaceae bacterium]
MGTIVLNAKKRKIGFNKKVAYVTRAVRYNTIGTDELLSHASADTGVSKAMLKATFEAMMQEIRQLALNGHSVQLGDLGTLKFSISCKSVENKDDLSTDLIKTRRMVFRASSKLRDEMDDVKFDTVIVEDDDSSEG